MTAISQNKAGRREWIGLAILMLPTLLIAMDMTVLHLAIPSLSAELKPTSSQLLWITDIYGFMIAGSLVTMGTLGDRIGRRKLLLIGATAFGGASILAAFSPTASLLILSRAVLGIAGATLMPSTMSLIRNMFHDPGQRTVAIGIWVSGFSAGSAIGPLVGGFLLEYFWWGSVFLISVPVMVILLVTGRGLLPEYRDPNPGRFDILSAGLSLASVLLVIYGLKLIAEGGFALVPVIAVVGGLVIGAIFVQRQRILEDPLIDLRLFTVPAFSASLATYTFGIFFGFGIFLFIAQYLQLVLGLSPLQAGLWSVPGAFTFIFGSNIAPKLVRRIRPAILVSSGMIIAAVCFFMLTQIGTDSLFLVVASNTLMSLGFGVTFSLTVDLVVSAAPPERAGAASAIAETGAELGGALGLAVLGSLGTAIYRSALASSIPSDISPEVAHAVRETLGGAVVALQSLSDQVAAPILLAAQEAFIQGIHVNAWIGLFGFLGLAVLVATLLRHIEPHIGSGHDHDAPVHVESGILTSPMPEMQVGD